MNAPQPAVFQPDDRDDPAESFTDSNATSGVRRMSEVISQPVEWLWPGRIPRGELTLIEGDPQSAKSLLTADLAARVSTGRLMPDGAAGIEPAGALLLSGEDSVSKTLYHRLRAAGADMDRVAVFPDAVVLPDQLPELERAIDGIQAALLVIDPITMYLGRSVNNDQSVREALSPLRELAERTRVAVVLVRHLNKRVQQPALYRGAGSIGVVAATRSAFAVTKHPVRRDWKVLSHTKSNLGPLADELAFHVVADAENRPRIDWIGAADVSPEPGPPVTSRSTGKATTDSGVASRSLDPPRLNRISRTVTSGLLRALRLAAMLASALFSAAEWLAAELKHAADCARKQQRRRRRSRR